MKNHGQINLIKVIYQPEQNNKGKVKILDKRFMKNNKGKCKIIH